MINDEIKKNESIQTKEQRLEVDRIRVLNVETWINNHNQALIELLSKR